MDLDGLGLPGTWSVGPQGAKPVPALIALDEALLLLGLPSAARAVDVRSAHRAAIGALQAQLQAGTLDRSSFRVLTGRLDAALLSALAATPRVVPAAVRPPQPGSGSAPAVGLSLSTSSPTSPQAGAPGPGRTDDALRPGAAGAPHGTSAGTDGADARQRSPGSDPAATMFALKTMPLMNQSPPTRAQHDLWTAVLVPAAAGHGEAATALAATTAARTDSQLAAVVTHVALTLALADLPQDQRRALLPLAAGVYAQLEAVLPSRLLAGLPPRDLLGGLPIQLWNPGPEVWLTALVVALAVVTFAIWAGLR